MIHLTVLIPIRDEVDDVERLLPRLVRVLDQGERPYEIICIDDGSAPSMLAALRQLQRRTHSLRLLRLDRRSGLSAALGAGIAAARGDVVVAIEASGQYLPEQVPWLIERLARADVVFGRRHSLRSAKLWQSLVQLPRRLLLGLEARDPDCLFWAARREAIAGVDLQAGMHRFLGSLVNTRGFRVAEIHVDHQPLTADPWRETASVGNLLYVWWQRRNWRAYEVLEVRDETAIRRAAA
jgi:glycosyltransferase involved in cell wall biosynthesis